MFQLAGKFHKNFCSCGVVHKIGMCLVRVVIQAIWCMCYCLLSKWYKNLFFNG